MKDEHAQVQVAREWLENSSNYEMEALTLQGLQIERVEKGLIHCSFLIPNHLSDRDGNWHVGAMGILIDVVAACTVFSFSGSVIASVELSLSFYSTAKIHEEVEIKAKVVGQNGNLVSVEVEIKKKGNVEKIAVGKEWMSKVPPKGSPASKL